MGISLPTLNKINIQEIELLKSVLGIEFDTKSQEFVLKKSFSTHQLLELYTELKNTIWNSKNILASVQELEEEPPLSTRVHYFGSGRAEGLISYISKMGILGNEVIVEDPMCSLIHINSQYKDHPTKSPSLYVKYVYEHAVSMIHLEEWVRKGFIYFVPSLTLFDINAFWNLAEQNKKIAEKVDFDNLPGIKKSMRYSMAEGSLRIMLEFSRLTQNNYKIENIKKVFPKVDDDTAKKYLDMIRNQTLEEREEATVAWVLNKHKLPYKEKLALLSHYESSRPFNIERYLDISKLTGGIMSNSGMPLLQASYISEKFNCVPSTDNPGLIHMYEGWCDALKEDMDPNFEKVRTKVDLPFSFLDSLTLPFIEESRKKGLTNKVSTYLDEEWSKIRTANDKKGYLQAAHRYSNKIKDEFYQLEKESELINKELIRGAFQTGAAGIGTLAGAGTLVGFNLVTEFPLAIVGAISSMIVVATGTKKSYRRNKQQLESKPMALFLKAKKIKRKK